LGQKHETYNQHVVTGHRIASFATEFPVDEVSGPFRLLLQSGEDDVTQTHIMMQSVRPLVRVRQSCKANVVSGGSTTIGSPYR